LRHLRLHLAMHVQIHCAVDTGSSVTVISKLHPAMRFPIPTKILRPITGFWKMKEFRQPLNVSSLNGCLLARLEGVQVPRIEHLHARQLRRACNLMAPPWSCRSVRAKMFH
jgi:hypothetical protein